MKINDILKKGLKFQTPSGKDGRVISVEKDKSMASVWKNKIEMFVWIVTVKVDGETINMKFDQSDNLISLKYNYESFSNWRTKL